jgi:hypothetical protein
MIELQYVEPRTATRGVLPKAWLQLDNLQIFYLHSALWFHSILTPILAYRLTFSNGSS